jgi:hypothetical protein
MQGSASSSSPCCGADLAAAWDADQQLKRQRCQVRRPLAEFPVFFFLIYFFALQSRSFRCVACATLAKLGCAIAELVGCAVPWAAYGVGGFAKALFFWSQKFGHGENSFDF